jgi:hypothetical protein
LPGVRLPTFYGVITLTPQEFAGKMSYLNQKVLTRDGYIEDIHQEADRLLCEQLRLLGYVDGVELFKKLQKSYPYNYQLVAE